MGTGLLRLFAHNNEWWPALFVGLSVLGWIFNSFGMGMVIFTFYAEDAWNFFLIGISFWVLAGVIVAKFTYWPSPATKHRR